MLNLLHYEFENRWKARFNYILAYIVISIFILMLKKLHIFSYKIVIEERTIDLLTSCLVLLLEVLLLYRLVEPIYDFYKHLTHQSRFLYFQLPHSRLAMLSGKLIFAILQFTFISFLLFTMPMVFQNNYLALNTISLSALLMYIGEIINFSTITLLGFIIVIVNHSLLPKGKYRKYLSAFLYAFIVLLTRLSIDTFSIQVAVKRSMTQSTSTLLASLLLLITMYLINYYLYEEKLVLE